MVWADCALAVEAPPVTLTCTGWPHGRDPVTWTAMISPVRPDAAMAACVQDTPPVRALQLQPLRSPPQ